MKKYSVKTSCKIGVAVLGALGTAGCLWSIRRRQDRPIAILCPMEVESSELERGLTHRWQYRVGNFLISEGYLDGQFTVVVRCGIGMVNASVAAEYVIEHYRPRAIINQGTAGAHAPELHRGDIVLGRDLVHIGSYESKHRDEGTGSEPRDWKYTGIEMFRNGKNEFVTAFHSDEALLKAAESVKLTDRKILCGIIGSGDTWNREIDYIDNLRYNLGTDCEEMESFSIAQVCEMHHVPILVIRIISNNERYPEEPYYPQIAVECQAFVRRVLKEIR